MNRINTIRLFNQLVGFITLALLICSSYVRAETNTGWMSNPEHPPVTTRFVLTGQVNPDKKTVEGFLEVKLDKGWKTYWRSPGEGGVAPKIDWKESRNLSRAEWHWPYPQQYELLGINTLGYKGDVVIPITLHISDWSRPVALNATLTLSSCDTVCVLTDYPFTLTFNTNQLQLSESAAFQYAQAISLVPRSTSQITDLEARWDPQTNQLQVSLTRSLGWHNPELIVDSSHHKAKEYSFKPLSIRTTDNQATAIFAVSSWMRDIDLDQVPLFVSVKDEGVLAEANMVAGLGTVAGHQSSLLIMLLFAFVGGLILNVMPCVLPVLGMKLSSVIATQGLQKSQIRRQFVASSFGILCSFWLLAIFLWGLKLTGNAVGWGIQFQSPWFLGLMALVTGLFGANMLGLFNIMLPSKLSTWASTKGDDSAIGHFTQGVFATLLATPCSAPFLGTAVAFALGANSIELFAIFTALGLGMALPWLLVAAFPRLASLLPKPGKWMNKVKYTFGAMMLATCLWLLYLTSNHIPIFWVIVAALLLVVALLRAVKRVHGDKAFVTAGGLLLIGLSSSLVLGSITTEQWVKPLPDDLVWRSLDKNDISRAVSQGKTVFVNVTADWCVTCKANKVGVLLQDPVYSTLKQDSIIPMQGDWTHPDSAVSRYLRENGRFGVPFNIVYGSARPQGIPLPVILTEESVMQAIHTAQGSDHQ